MGPLKVPTTWLEKTEKNRDLTPLIAKSWTKNPLCDRFDPKCGGVGTFSLVRKHAGFSENGDRFVVVVVGCYVTFDPLD